MKNDNKNKNKHFVTVCCAIMLGWSSLVVAASGFVVKAIKVVGLQRVSTGTVLNYLPVQVGEEVNTSSTPEIIKALYDTGFFQSVSLERQGNTLIINVIERATIGEINLVGNTDIPTDSMKDFLKQMGLVKGRIFQRSSLERLEKELKQAYNARGKYNARVDAKVTPLSENRVTITITVSEGRVSRIREIKFTGNHDFSNNELLAEMSLSTSNIFTYFTKKDQYSKEAMDASLEAIRAFYLDRGYLKFNIVSSQVMLSPDKKDVFITIHLQEGPQYRFAGYGVVGRTILPRDKIDALILIQKGAVFSRKVVTESVSALNLALGDVGYGFPVINPDPRVDEEHKTVFITFVMEPGRHVYVRRINFHGNTRTADYVLRSAIRQNEGALLSLHNIKESERQLRLLGYLKDVNIRTTPVTGANNQVDLDVQVEEAGAAEMSASLGYGSNGPQVSAKINHRNFMGTGQAVGANFNASFWGQDYSLSYYNPFYTTTGIGRGISAYYQSYDPKNLDVITYSSDKLGVDVVYGMLLSEQSSVQFGYGYQNLFIRSVGIVQQIQNFVNLYGRSFNELRLTGGWTLNTYDQLPFPTRGTNQQVNGIIAIPLTSTSLSYYRGTYSARWYQPLPKGFIFSLLGNVGYGNGFSGQSLPFFENYYAGGIAQPGQVRGYESFSLGPQDSTGVRAMGGNFLASGSAGIVLPYPLSRDNLRTTVFLDIGNVYAKGTPISLAGVGGGPLRYSAGVSFDWRSPLGPLTFSIAKPLNLQPGDVSNVFQFSVSSAL